MAKRRRKGSKKRGRKTASRARSRARKGKTKMVKASDILSGSLRVKVK